MVVGRMSRRRGVSLSEASTMICQDRDLSKGVGPLLEHDYTSSPPHQLSTLNRHGPGLFMMFTCSVACVIHEEIL